MSTAASSIAPPMVQRRPISGFVRRATNATARCLTFFWKYTVGVVLCQNPIGGIMVIGWTYRLVQRSILKQWWSRSGLPAQGVAFSEFVDADDVTRSHLHGPNWIIQQNAWSSTRSKDLTAGQKLGAGVKMPIHSLWLNLKIGFQGIFNTWVLTLPGCFLWLFAWHAGWNNSFHKQYEQFWVGALAGWTGVVLFMLAMAYVPMAQVRQAATGDWRTFYDFRFVRTLIRERWFASLLLAVLYAVFSVPVMTLKTLPFAFQHIAEENGLSMAEMTDAQVLEYLGFYFLAAAAIVFPAYVALRWVAGRIYGSAILSLDAKGVLDKDALAPIERHTLSRLGRLRGESPTQRHVLLRMARWSGSQVGRKVTAAAMVIVWFTFTAQIFVSEFFNYHPFVGWMNQPLVQLPWFRYIPPHLGGG